MVKGRRHELSGALTWLRPVLSTSDEDLLQGCGLDAFFFLRFLRTILKVFIPSAGLVLPILIPLNVVHGKRSDVGVQGLNRLTWAGVGFTHSDYYWAHAIIAVVVITGICYVLYGEFHYYINIRHKYFASFTSTTTVLVSGIPQRLRSVDTLTDIYENIGEGVRTVWLNRDCTALNQKLQYRDQLIARLEGAEARVIRKAVKAVNKTQREAQDCSAHEDSNDRHMLEGYTMWSKVLGDKDRPSMRLPIFRRTWMPSLPLLGQKVDVIHHCRKEIARLNIEIEEDQRTPSKFPCLDSAFIQFKRPVDAHIVCQSVAYHKPYQCCPQQADITPTAVVWKYVSVRWWERHLRTLVVVAAIVALIIGWTVPVAFTGFLSQLGSLTTLLPWLTHIPPWLFGVIQGALPQTLLLILTLQLPNIIKQLTQYQGFASSRDVELAVQRYYFCFLFTQVFLTVALSSSVTTLLENIYHGFDSVPEVLATNLPKSSNYFLSYLLLHAFSMSASQLAQIGGLVQRFVLSPLLDSTPRQKFKRRSSLSRVSWGTTYPVYTNLACIGMREPCTLPAAEYSIETGVAYSIIAPLMTLFVPIAFGMLWLVFRYNALYVVRPENDTGGLLYPTALNQLFTGVYILEICLIGLFLLVRDEGQVWCCIGQAAIMVLTTVLTIGFQVLMNCAFGPLLVFLPTMQHRYDGERSQGQFQSTRRVDCNRQEPPSPNQGATTSPFLFQHIALFVQPPTIWIPKDGLGVSDSEVSQTRATSANISISNEGAPMDSKGRIQTDCHPSGWRI